MQSNRNKTTMRQRASLPRLEDGAGGLGAPARALAAGLGAAGQQRPRSLLISVLRRRRRTGAADRRRHSAACRPGCGRPRWTEMGRAGRCGSADLADIPIVLRTDQRQWRNSVPGRSINYPPIAFQLPRRRSRRSRARRSNKWAVRPDSGSGLSRASGLAACRRPHRQADGGAGL
jgi:hypothetical protein